MANRLMHLRVADSLYRDATLASREHGYSNVQEFCRSALRKAIEEYRLQLDLATIRRLKGSVKTARRLTIRERDRIARQFARDVSKGRDVLNDLY